ncbi:hypothetical protein [Halostella salina]|uniref:hypothetical protein n=1 Tax=Halostella salina TaxID=1547897 RepID=UPI000EF780DF|nr:hypothetical protein [Halostella salina]
MNREIRDLVLSLLVVGATAALGLLRRRDRDDGATTSVAARVVDEPPAGADVLDDGGRFLDRVPGVGTAVQRATEQDVRDDWAAVDVTGRDALALVDVLQEDLPYHTAPADGDHESGVYVEYGGSTVVVTAVGWERLRNRRR